MMVTPGIASVVSRTVVTTDGSEVSFRHDALKLKVDDGDNVQSGSPVLSLERTGPDVRDIQVIAYVSALEAKRIQPGMTMLVSPSNVKKEEHGLLYAKVEEVAAFPATPEGMLRTLRNRHLVNDLSAQHAATQISGDLVPDARTVSEYRWTSRKGPPIELQSGTICTVSITVEKRRPIKLLLPTVRRYLGV